MKNYTRKRRCPTWRSLWWIAGILLFFEWPDAEAGLFGARREERRQRRMQKRLERKLSKSDTQSAELVKITGTFDSYRESTYGPGDYRRSLTHDGMDRFYDLHIPPSYTDEEAMPVVLAFHGGGGSPGQQRRDSQMDAGSDAESFIVAYPAGTGPLKTHLLTYNAGICCGPAKKNNVDDVGFTRAVLEDLETLFHIDRKRVYATGFSNGGFLCYRLACELSHQIAAIAPVSAVLGMEFSQCERARAMPIIHFHGKQDQHAVYKGGIGPNAREKIPRKSVPETIMFWVEHNGLPKEPTATYREGNAVGVVYGSDDEAQVILWTIEDGGHTWPGGQSSLSESKVGKLSHDISASERIWSFFERYTLP